MTMRRISLAAPLFMVLAMVSVCPKLMAQNSLSVSPAAGVLGTQVTLDIGLTGTAGNLPSAVEWTFSYSTTDFSAVSWSAGPAASAAGKSISCSSLAGTSTCVVWGSNQTSINDGTLAMVTLTISPATTNQASAVQVSASGSTSATGSSIATAGSSATVTIVQFTPTLLVSCNPSTVTGGSPAACSLTLSNAAGAGGVSVAMGSSSGLVSVPPSVVIPAGSRSANFTATTAATTNTTLATITASAGTTVRTTVLTVGGPCNFTVTPTARLFSAGGGSTLVSVSASSGCQWTATTDSPAWITLQSGGVSGNGNGSFTYSVGTNLTVARLGTIAVGNQSFKVMEGGIVSLQPFTDVTAASVDFDYISLLWTSNITDGCLATPLSYCPTESVTRGQMATFVVSALDRVNHAQGALPPVYTVSPGYFQDEPSSDVYYPFVQRLADLGITNGCSANPPLFCTSSSIPQNQMAKFMITGWMHANHQNTFTYTPTPYFSDVPSTDPYFSYVQKMRDLGVWSGCGGGRYCPTSLVARQDMAAMIMRALVGAP